MPPLPEVLVVEDALRRVRVAPDVADLAVVFRTPAWKKAKPHDVGAVKYLKTLNPKRC